MLCSYIHILGLSAKPNSSSMLISCFIFQVFDCWFESGSMPYAYIHYPFENVELFEKNFPGHFVAEGLDQTRGWLVLLSLSFLLDISDHTCL